MTKVDITGRSCRLPGAAGVSEFWDLLAAGRCSVSTLPVERFQTGWYLNQRKGEPGKSYTFAAGSLGDVWGFDPAAFNISRREAGQIDPQQRLVLQLAWEALEDAGVPPSTLSGKNVGVYIGASSMDYSHRQFFDPAGTDSYLMTGNTLSLISNRISYIFNLTGPSVTIDTACSSSLVALKYALNDLRSGEIDTAIVGGVNCLLSPFNFIGFCAASMLSPDGLCRPFDHRANGYVRAEGGVVIVLQRRDLARSGRSYGEILTCAMNSDGRTSGVALPSAERQAALLRRIYDENGIDPERLAFVEAHGTGTLVGDPAEAGAIGAALGQRRSAPLPIGSAKSNVGHLEPASGLVGLLKSLLALEKGRLPATLHVEKLNPSIPFDDLNLAVATEPVTLPPSAGTDLPHLAGVNNFGFGGTNVHVVVAAPPPRSRAKNAAGAGLNGIAEANSQRRVPLLVSAHCTGALRERAAAYRDLLAQSTALPGSRGAEDLARAIVHDGDILRERLCVGAGEPSEWIAALDAFVDGKPSAGVVIGTAAARQAPVALVFSGNGSQWAGMGKAAFGASTLFRERYREVDSKFSSLGGWSLEEQLFAGDLAEKLKRTEIAQPLLFALQVGMARALQDSGLRPTAVLGHSVGEVAAAHISGALDLDDAVRVIWARSHHQELASGLGRMAAVQFSAEEAAEFMARHALEGLEVAAINARKSVTVAGETAAVERLVELAHRDGIASTLLEINYPFHSSILEPVRAPLLASLSDLKPGHTDIPFYSTVFGEKTAGDILDASYWWLNVRKPVAFNAAVLAAVESGCRVFIEVGPRSVLRNYLSDTLAGVDDETRVLGTLERDAASGTDEIQLALARATVAGATVDLVTMFGTPLPDRMPLPRYPWQNQPFKFTGSSEALSIFSSDLPPHPLLGTQLRLADWLWESHVDAGATAFLADHKVGNRVIMPGAAFVDMMLEAAQHYLGTDAIELRDIDFMQALELGTQSCETVSTRVDVDSASISISSKPRLSTYDPTVNVRARLARRPSNGPAANVRPVITERDDAPILQRVYQLAKRFGINYGPAFQRITACREIDDTIEVELSQPDIPSSERACLLHPVDFDACFHGLNVVFDRLEFGERKLAYVPVHVSRFVLFRSGQRVRSARIRLESYNTRAVCADFELFSAAGDLIAIATGVRFKAANIVHRSSLEQIAYHTAGLRLPYPSAENTPEPGSLARLTDFVRTALEARAGASAKERRENANLCDLAARRIALDALQAMADSTRRVLATDMPDTEVALTIRGLLGRLNEVGLAEFSSDGWRLVSSVELPEASAVLREILLGAPDWLAETALLNNAQLALRALFAGAGQSGRDEGNGGEVESGATGARESALDGTSGDTAERALAPLVEHYLSHSPLARLQTAVVLDILDHLCADWPSGKPLRILQIGYSGEGLTRRLLARLPVDTTALVVAETSASAVARLKSAFVDVSNLEIVHLPLQTDALASLPPVDIVVSVNGLTNLTDVEGGLAQLSKMLSPDTVAIVSEGAPTAFTDVVFGAQPGWFRDVGTNASPQGAARSMPEWGRILEGVGWQNIAMVVESNGDRETSDFGVLLAQPGQGEGSITPDRSAEQPDRWSPALPGDGEDRAGAGSTDVSANEQPVWLVHDGAEPAEGEFIHTLQGALRDAGYRAALVNPADLADPMRLEGGETLTDERVPLVIHVATPPSGARDPDASDDDRLGTELMQLRDLLIGLSARSGRLVVLAGGGARASVGLGRAVPASTALWSFARTALNEFAGVGVWLVDWSEALSPSRIAARLAAFIAAPPAAREVVLDEDAYVALQVRRGLPAVARAAPAEEGTSSNAARVLEISQQGNLDALRWMNCARRAPGEDEVEIEVTASGLNFRDVMWALGLLPEEALEDGFTGPSLGFECAGRVVRIGARVSGLQVGDRVMALAPSSFASHVTVRRHAVTAVPASLTLEAAATVPVAFLTAVYALENLATLRQGEVVLIHGAAGGVGLAAMQVAKAAGAIVIATAGSENKRRLLTALGADHVFSSRSLSFVDEVRSVFADGVDVVLNSLAGEAMERSIELIRPFGRFLELGKRDFYANSKIGLRPFRRNVTYFGIDADQLLTYRPEMAAQIMAHVSEGFEAGQFSPLPYREYDSGEVVEAFRLMQKSGHTGKILVRAPKTERADVAVSREFKANSEGTHIIVGGTGGFGLEMAAWLADRGARRIVLTSRSGGAEKAREELARRLSRMDVDLRVVACDVTNEAALAELLRRLRAEGPIVGIAHAAMVLDDCVITNLTRERLDAVLAPKVAGARILDRLTAVDDPDYVIFFSSAAALFGNPGQASYVAANGYLDGLARVRAARGQKAISVAWGAISDVGVLTRRKEAVQSLGRHIGTFEFSAREGLDLLASILAEEASHRASVNVVLASVDWSAAASVLPIMATPAYSVMRRHVRGDAELSGGGIDLGAAIADLDDVAARDLVARYVIEEVAGIFRMPAGDISARRPLADLGMDSLMGLELRISVERNLGVELPLVALSEGTTINDVAGSIVAKLRPGQAVAPPENGEREKMMQMHLGETIEDVEALAQQIAQREQSLDQVI